MSASLTCAAIALHLVAAVNANTGAGLLPIRAGEQGKPAVTQSLTPSLSLVEPTPLGLRFSATYAPRAFYRFPNVLGLSRPALLHTVRLQYSPVLQQRTTVSIVGAGNLGESDYTTTTDVFGDGQTVSPDQAFIRVRNASVNLSIHRLLTRRWDLTLQFPAFYQKTTAGSNAPQLGATRGAGAQSNVSYALDGGNRLGAGLSATVVTFDESRQLVSRSMVTWSRQFTERFSSSASAGVGRVDVLRESELDQQLEVPDTRYFGVASLAAARQRDDGQEQAQLTLDARVDPISQRTIPQGGVAVSSSQALSRRTTFGANLSGYTEVSSEPLNTFSATGVNSTVAVSWVKQPTTLRWGIRAGFRAPHLAEPFQVRETTLMATFGITWVIEDGRRTP